MGGGVRGVTRGAPRVDVRADEKKMPEIAQPSAWMPTKLRSDAFWSRGSTDDTTSTSTFVATW